MPAKGVGDCDPQASDHRRRLPMVETSRLRRVAMPQEQSGLFRLLGYMYKYQYVMGLHDFRLPAIVQSGTTFAG